MRSDPSRLPSRLGRLLALAILAGLLGAACSANNPTSAATSGPTEQPSEAASAPASQEAGSSASAAVEASPSVAPTPVPTATPTATPAPTPTPAPKTPSVSGVLVKSAAPNGAWTVSFKKPVVSGTAKKVAINAKIASSISGLISAFTTGLPEMMENMPSTLTGEYSIAYASPRLLALRLSRSEYASGAAHPVDYVTTLNFDLLTGKTIGFGDLFTDVSSALGILSTQSRQLLAAQQGSYADAGMINGGTTPVAANFAAWALTAAGMEITFPEYAVAPYAAGLLTVVVPWSALNPVMKPNGPAAELLQG